MVEYERLRSEERTQQRDSPRQSTGSASQRSSRDQDARVASGVSLLRSAEESACKTASVAAGLQTQYNTQPSEVDVPRRSRLLTTVLVYGASVLERADEQILPSAYLFIGRSLFVSPTELGALTFARALVQALSSPVSGVLGDRYDRTWIIALGCSVWGLMTAMFGFVTSLSMAMVLSAASGFGLSLVIPCCQSMIADYYPAKDRGKAFGMLFMVSILGGLCGGMLATNLGGMILFGMEGWRAVYQLVGMVSILSGVLVFYFASDPRPTLQNGMRAQSESLWAEALMIFKLRTFQVIIAQGIVGSMPWFVMGYFTLWFQLLGFSDFQASLLMGVFQIGNAKGSFVGGWLGDIAAEWSNNHGRILVAQVSVLSGLPVIYFLLKILPTWAGVSFWPYFILLWTMGMLVSWCATSCNNPVFADIVPEHLRSMIYAYDRCMEGGIAAMITPLVGLLAEQTFKYQKPDPLHPMSTEESLHNADALGSALVVTCTVPWLLCFVCYGLLHKVYANDRDFAAAAAFKRSQRKEVEPTGNA